jgi:hypothetical protein
MIAVKEIQAQLRRIGFRGGFLGRAEINELPRILMPGEQIHQVVIGWYKGGMALLCATDQRVLLIDKKVFFLTVEDVRYDLIAEVMYQYRLMDSTIVLTYAPKSLQFTCWNQAKMRQLASYVQQQVAMEMRVPVQNSINSMPDYQQGMPFSRGTTSFVSINRGMYQPAAPAIPITFPATERPLLPLNPYQSRLPFRRRKISRFVTSSQMAR